jgi:hypothetical protein
MIAMMRFLTRALLFLLVAGALAYGAAYFYAGTLPGPVVAVRAPDKYVGQNTQLEFSVETPGGTFSSIEAVLEQDGQATTVFTTDPSAQPAGEMKQESANRIFVIRPIGKQALPNLKAGPARVTVTASQPVFYDIRIATTSVTRDLEVRLEPPRVGVLSLHHFVNHGGPEFVVFHAERRLGRRARRRGRLSGISGQQRRHSGSGRARGVLRARLRSGPQRADFGLRAGRGRQPGDQPGGASGDAQAVCQVTD